jgi:hypothetical protein
MIGQKRQEIRLGNPHQAIDPVRDEELLFDPAPNRARRGFDPLGDLRDRVEFCWGLFSFASSK